MDEPFSCVCGQQKAPISIHGIYCNSCFRWFHSDCVGLTDEYVSALGETDDPWFCSSCTAATQVPSQSNTDQVTCQYCGKPYTRRGITRHINAAHKEEPPLTSPLTTSPPQPFDQELSFKKRNVRILKRVPKAARVVVAYRLGALIEKCVEQNDLPSWQDLLQFVYRVLKVPENKKKSLAKHVKQNLAHMTDAPILPRSQKEPIPISRRVESKFSLADVRGAMRVITSDDVLAPDNASTLEKLIEKHPVAEKTIDSPPVSLPQPVQVTPDEVTKAIYSFPKGSAAGMDSLSPQHLQDLVSLNHDASNKLVASLTNLCNLMLAGQVCEDILPVIYGASLCALSKKDGGIRPIAVGLTYRRLAGKLGCKSVANSIGDFLRPIQVGVATKGGCEAAVHSVREYINRNKGSNKILLKLDLKNAFNSIERQDVLRAVLDKTPSLFPYIYQSYSKPSKLFFGQHCVQSQRGAQQGDPCGPLIFSLGIHPVLQDLLSELNIWYLDDGTLAGDPEVVLRDFAMIKSRFKEIGLEVNPSKCEVFFLGNVCQSTMDLLNSLSPGIIHIKDGLTLLGAPLQQSAVAKLFATKFEEIKRLIERISDLKYHIGYFLLRNCALIPKLTYLLRTCPTFCEPGIIKTMDELILQGIEKICNVSISPEQAILASLPVKLGGIGIRRTEDISIPAFVSSIYSTLDLVNTILPFYLDLTNVDWFRCAMDKWISLNSDSLPQDLTSQKSWDNINMLRILDSFTAEDDVSKARMLALSRPESSAWLNVLPSVAVDTLLDNNTFRISLGLRLGLNICCPYTCVCGDPVDSLGIHGLACIKASGRHYRHQRVNDVIKRAIISSGFPAVLEPAGLCRSDGKRPDGMTIVPWTQGKVLVWDFTCSDTMAASNIKKAISECGAVAKQAAANKVKKYQDIISQGYYFVPFAVETFGPWCEEALDLIEQISSRSKLVTGENRTKQYLTQRISLEIQRGNSASILGTMPRCIPMDELNYLL